ncbi:hypothetical protein [Dehalogenimonas etheniformans]|uniref:Terminase large subunit gp17-like C-terminal domain-containing protein n=1 Tax=Dehalogenimonas etheniformans TaxID=1536648 RepID=A0A2P5P652_9CHLR|nr:hypothetical protein [Dehalogenimonas etheniformans]PPD57774.1 hypothetical protein JP09_008545 [Dehalogenimonas etheniformans]QNT76115.1 hypothetical protein HX448_05115 [Dehalogenimonas etheniformans]
MNFSSSTIEDFYPYQREVFEAVKDSVLNRRGLTFTVEIARQGGKNELSAWLEARFLAQYLEFPLNIVKCAPTFKPQALISLRRLCDCLDMMNFAGDYAIESGHIVRLGDARAIFMSAEPSANVVGNTAHLLLEVDEAQDVSIEKFDRDFRPMAATRNATTVLYGTPWREGNLLDTVKSRNLELERSDGIKRHFRFDWEEVGRCNADYRSYVEGERARLGENHPTFRTQYALQNVSNGGGFFSDEQLISMAGDFPRCRFPKPGAVYVGGLDFGGEGNAACDSTVLTIAEISTSSPPRGEGREMGLHIVNHYSWTGLPYTLLLQKITDAAKGWGLKRLVADATGLGSPLCSSLKQSLGHRFVSFVFTASSKSTLGYELLAAAGTGRLQLYARDGSMECEECWRQLESAAADYKPNRALNFYVDPSKAHDDYLMSLALTVEAARRYEPRAAVGRSQ